MAKKKQRSKRITFLIYLLSIIIVCIIVFNIILSLKAENIANEINIIHNEYAELEKELENKNNDLTEIDEQTKIIINIDDNIAEIKKEYFSNIKTLEDKILASESDKKIAYLTFDDGPYYLSYKYLEVLDKYDVLATFFTIGNNKEVCYDNKSANCYLLYNEEAKRGHTMANHTFSHGIFRGLYSSPTNFIEQVKKQEELIRNQTGVTTNIVRFPGGSATAGKYKNAIIELLRANGYGWVDWTAATGDGGSLASADQAWNNFVNSIDSNIEVILMHDYNHYTLEILPKEIEYLKENGYSLFPLFYESNMVNK
ncbi:MAG: polysaccharide deacetylase family protein [Bacilli bacterium]|nr:polysaccharide deacetylase family protein [Bacilli bacterium]